MSAGNHTEALNKAEEAAEKYPEHTGFIQLVGENQLKLGRTEDAKDLSNVLLSSALRT